MAGKSNGTALAAPKANGQAPAAVAPGDESTATKRALAMLQRSYDKIAEAAPSHLTPERMIQVVSAMVFRTPTLQECDPASIVNAVIRSASLGLDLDPALNEGFLIPRYNDKIKAKECQFQIGYQGLRKLALNSGRVAYIHARLIRERDSFHYEFTPDLEFRHVPAMGDPGAVTHVYCVGKLDSGDHLIETMTADEVELIHQRSDGYKKAKKNGWTESGPWVTDWEEMAKKTVLKRLAKSLPRSLELARAIEQDNEEYTEGGDIVVSSRPGQSRSALLRQRLAAPPALEAPEPEFTPGTSGQIKTEADDDFVDAGEVEADRGEGT